MYHRIKRLFSIYVAYHLPDPAGGRMARLRLLPGFLWAGIRAFPAALRWVRQRDPAARARVKQLLDLSGPAPVALEDGIFAAKQAQISPEDAAVTVVMPVYGNLPMTREALRRLVAHTDLPWRLVLIDDGSPDPESAPALRAFAKAHAGQVTLIENARNLGFVGSINKGLKQALNWPDPVVLLNTDAYLPQGWAVRLLRPIWQDARTASVTPLSNDAELGSVPLPGRARGIDAALADALDQTARGLNGAAGQVAAPAGVGFCMALSPEFLRRLPQLDEAFSPGYGEEVDWCRQAAALGGRHVYVPDLFVAHMGGQSFGSEAKQRLIARNSEILTRRYPGFDAEVHGFLRRDPLAAARLALGLAWADRIRGDRRLPVYFAHSMGGGAEIDLGRRIRADLETDLPVCVIRFGGVFRFTPELWWPGEDRPLAAGCKDWTLVQALLAPVGARQLIYSNAVGDPDPYAIPGLIQSLFRHESDRIQVLLHDYFPLSPSLTLLGQGDVFTGLPSDADQLHIARRPDGARVPLAAWQEAWGALLRQAEQVVCFSQASADLLRGVYPDLAQIVIRPHALHADVPLIAAPQGKPVIGILGNLAPHKGAAVAEGLSRHLAQKRQGGALGVEQGGRPEVGPDVGLVLLGDMDPNHRLHVPARQHGRYAIDALPALVARYGITCWLIPSIWPETFSFTTHEALATGLPVIAFDLGAQGAAVRAAVAAGAPGAVMPLAQGRAPEPKDIVALAAELSARTGQGT